MLVQRATLIQQEREASHTVLRCATEDEAIGALTPRKITSPKKKFIKHTPHHVGIFRNVSITHQITTIGIDQKFQHTC